MLDFDGSRKARRRELAIAASVLLLALILYRLPPAYQSPIRQAIQGSVLRPFVTGQSMLAMRRANSMDITLIRAQRDSLVALVSAQATLGEENRRLRELSGLRARTGPSFIPAEVLHLGVSSAEGTFIVNVGKLQGVRVNSPVIAPEGLLGIVVEVSEQTAQAMDWTNENFRASAMTLDGKAYGIVQARPREFREESLLALTGAPFHSDIQPGTPVVTTGRGGVLPRGIPLGVAIQIEEADTGWRKSYLLRPAVQPEAATQVLVGVGDPGAELSDLWYGKTTVDSVVAVPAPARGGRGTPRRDTVAARRDTVAARRDTAAARRDTATTTRQD